MNNLKWWILKNKTHNEILSILKEESKKRPWCLYFLEDSPYFPSNLNSKCRIGYVPYDKCIQDRFFYIDKSRSPEIVASGGITTQIYWDHDPKTLPAGWQGSVQKSFIDTNKKHDPNTMVALLAFTAQRFRKKGLSGLVLSKMIENAKEAGYKSLLVPSLPPSQFEKDKVDISMEELSSLKRDDGSYYDYWVRVHTDKGADVIGVCDTSHRFIFNIKDFSEYVSSIPIISTGEHIVTLDRDLILGPNRKNMFQKVYADVDRDLVTFNWGCIWTKYDLSQF